MNGGDLDGDSDFDFIGSSFTVLGNVEVVWWQNTDGTGTNLIRHTLDGNLPEADTIRLVTADLDEDGDVDLVGAGGDCCGLEHISWWENLTGDGTNWVRRVVDNTVPEPWAILTADVDTDGDLDIVGSVLFAADVSWWENLSGDALNWSEHLVAGDFGSAVSIVAGDFDADDDPDLFAASQLGFVVAWWENRNATGTVWWGYGVETNWQGAQSLFVDDMDGDGDQDLLGAARWADEIAWWENADGMGTALIRHTIETNYDGAGSALALDVDSDGDPDVVGAGSHANRLDWWENRRICWKASFPVEHPVDTNFSGARFAYPVDMDGDVDLDILGVKIGAWNWYENFGGSGTAWVVHSLTGFPTVGYPADIDGDDDKDLFFAGARVVAAFHNQDGSGTSWGQANSFYMNFPNPPARLLHAADMDRDGDMDLVSTFPEEYGASIRWHENLDGVGTNLWGPRDVTDLPYASAARAFDLDGDHDRDVLAVFSSSKTLCWLENIGGTATNWVLHAITTNLAGASPAWAADVDGDARMDVVAASASADSITWWRNLDGSATNWMLNAVATNFDGASFVVAADLDCDGDQDILGASSIAGTVAWWENTDGSGTSFVEHVVTVSFAGAAFVAAADMDQDGDVDIVGAGANGIRWWENQYAFGCASGSFAQDGELSYAWEAVKDAAYLFQASSNPAIPESWMNVLGPVTAESEVVVYTPTNDAQQTLILRAVALP